MKKIIFLFIFIISYHLVHSQVIIPYEQFFLIQTDFYNLKISKFNGMIVSAKVKNINFELVSDFSSGVVGSFYTLFFPEFSPEYTYTTVSNYEFYIPGYDGTDVTYNIKCNNESIGIIEINCETDYISTNWEYHFMKDQCYFSIDVNKFINTSNVYSNAQQCVMFNSDFDDTYIVDYSGNVHCTMSDNIYTYPSSATFQHTMYSAIDEGLTEIFPMMGWHDDEYDVVAGIICPYVSPNQRKTISYHGGGSNNQHPGFSEGQWNWFGKSDSESLYLVEGVEYKMQMYYYLDTGSISELIDFNQNIFNEDYHVQHTYENYSAASFGARTSRLENYFWRFPQASSNYICSQELYRPRCFAIPSSQNGTGDPHLFNYYVKYSVNNNTYDLTPIYGTVSLFEEAETIILDSSMTGSMTWNVNSIHNTLNYTVYEESDKILISGEITVPDNTFLQELYVELEFSPRIIDVFSIGDSIFDFRSLDDVYGQIGIALYNIYNIDHININEDNMKLYLIENPLGIITSDSTVFQYSFTLFPHVGYNVESSSDITPLLSFPEESYKEYYTTLPDLVGNNSYGMCPSLDAFPYHAEIGRDSLLLTLDVFCDEGEYPLNLYIDVPEIKTVIINDQHFQSWSFDATLKELSINNFWFQDDYEIKIYNTEIDTVIIYPTFEVYPNPSFNNTTISFQLPKQQNYNIKILNLKGQLIKKYSGSAENKVIYWDGRGNDTSYSASGIYFIEFQSDCIRLIKPILYFHD